MIKCVNISCESEEINWGNIKKIRMKGWWDKAGSNSPWRPLTSNYDCDVHHFLKVDKNVKFDILIMLKKLQLAKILNPKLEAHKKKLILNILIKSTQYIPLWPVMGWPNRNLIMATEFGNLIFLV